MYKDKKGQVTIFVVLAIVIVGALIVFLTSTNIGKETLQRFTDSGDFDVTGSIESCVRDSVEYEGIGKILSQGGNLDPELSYMHQGQEYSYLCYTNQYLIPCINQQPLLLQHVELEIQEAIIPSVNNCINSVKTQLDQLNYDVSNGNLNVEVEIIPENININIDYPISISKNDNQRQFGGFQVRRTSEAYHLITLASSIINFEARYGDSDPASYMVLYPSTKVEKLKQGEGTTLYKITDRKSGEGFNFASRSYVFPPGYQ